MTARCYCVWSQVDICRSQSTSSSSFQTYCHDCNTRPTSASTRSLLASTMTQYSVVPAARCSTIGDRALAVAGHFLLSKHTWSHNLFNISFPSVWLYHSLFFLYRPLASCSRLCCIRLFVIIPLHYITNVHSPSCSPISLPTWCLFSAWKSLSAYVSSLQCWWSALQCMHAADTWRCQLLSRSTHYASWSEGKLPVSSPPSVTVTLWTLNNRNAIVYFYASAGYAQRMLLCLYCLPCPDVPYCLQGGRVH